MIQIDVSPFPWVSFVGSLNVSYGARWTYLLDTTKCSYFCLIPLFLSQEIILHHDSQQAKTISGTTHCHVQSLKAGINHLLKQLALITLTT